jgi:hypothetical protein
MIVIKILSFIIYNIIFIIVILLLLLLKLYPYYLHVCFKLQSYYNVKQISTVIVLTNILCLLFGFSYSDRCLFYFFYIFPIIMIALIKYIKFITYAAYY